MKSNILLVTLALLPILSFGQKINYNLENGFIADGYDVVAYYSNKAIKGKAEYTTSRDGAKYKFSSKENLNKFESNPSKYIPQYGGWCAYAMATTGQKVSIDPETFEIRDGKLYLFYNSWGNNTLKSWLKENPLLLIQKANTNWRKIKFEK
ncbi:MAG: hypothetical protein RL266_140 [Bacteroidota bacterium]|jgi:YHS domain-containing protein